MSGYIRDFRKAWREGDEALVRHFNANTIAKEIASAAETISAKKIGALATHEFEHELRAGLIEDVFKKVDANIMPVLKENSSTLTIMKREAETMPEHTVQQVVEESNIVAEKLPKLETAANAQEIESIVSKERDVKKALDNIEKDVKAQGSNGKYYFVGAAVAAGSLGIYEAIEAYARAKTGCFLYTRAGTHITACKVLNASCLNPTADSNIVTCTNDIMGAELTAVTCTGWSEAKDGACTHCSAATFEHTKLKDTQSLQCIEKPSFGQAIGELIYTSGQSLVNGISGLLKQIIYYALIVGAVLLGVWGLIFIFKQVFKKKPVEQQPPPQQPVYYAPAPTTYPTTYPPPQQPQQQQQQPPQQQTFTQQPLLPPPQQQQTVQPASELTVPALTGPYIATINSSLGLANRALNSVQDLSSIKEDLNSIRYNQRPFRNIVY